MFCNQCGANLPDGATHCTMCGAMQDANPQPVPVEDDWDKTQRVRSAPGQNPNPAPQPAASGWNTVPQPVAPVAPVAPAAPAWNEQPAAPAWNEQPAAPAWNEQPQQNWNSQPSYDWNSQPQYAAPKKKSALPIMITGILSVVLIIFSALAPLTMQMTDIPILSVVEDAKEEFEDALEQAKYDLEEHEADLEMAKEELTDDQVKAVENAEEKVRELIDNCTIMNLNAAADALLALEDELAGYQNEFLEEFAGELDTLKEMKEALVNTMIGVCIGAFVLPLLFAILAFALKKTALTVVALILTAIPQAILSGALYIVLSAVVYIVQIVLCSQYKKA